MNGTAIPRFLTRLASSFEDGSFVKATLGHPAPGAELRKLMLRPVVIRGEKCCCVVSRFVSRDETKNRSFAETLALVEAALGPQFQSAHLFTESEDLQLELAPKERLRTVKTGRAPAALEHDRNRVRWVETRARYLQELEVTDSRGKVRERMGDKFRQIERFVDLLASAFRESDLATTTEPIAMCDMGSGKGYLTFAAYDYFQRVEKRRASVTGVEARPDLVALCNRVARDCNFAGLQFVESPIADYPLPPRLDILVALHACNTATDDALHAGLRAGASILLAAPCCHKESRPQLDRAAHTGPLRDLLRHGLFAERHAEMATDALRVLLLERAGYRVRVSEFVAAEHTAKNVMLLATKRRPLSPEAVAELDDRIARLKAFYGIERNTLEDLLRDTCIHHPIH